MIGDNIMTFKITLEDILKHSIASLKDVRNNKIYSNMPCKDQMKFAIKQSNPEKGEDICKALLGAEFIQMENCFAEYMSKNGMSTLQDCMEYQVDNYIISISISNNPLLKYMLTYREKDNQTSLF